MVVEKFPKKQKLRIYADTSVFGGFFEQEFSFATKAFFKEVEKGHFQIVTSYLVTQELVGAPKHVLELFEEFLSSSEDAKITAEMLDLRDKYLKAGILTKKSSADALHVAIATIADCFLICSWNFRHIVHYEKIPLFNAVNLNNGWKPLLIHTPREVITYGSKD